MNSNNDYYYILLVKSHIQESVGFITLFKELLASYSDENQTCVKNVAREGQLIFAAAFLHDRNKPTGAIFNFS